MLPESLDDKLDELDELDELYDELTRRRIERGSVRAGRRIGVRRPVVGSARRAVGGGVLLTAVALGLQEALDPTEDEAVIEEITPSDEEFEPAVILLLVPGAPRLSRAIVRPWLL